MPLSKGSCRYARRCATRPRIVDSVQSSTTRRAQVATRATDAAVRQSRANASSPCCFVQGYPALAVTVVRRQCPVSDEWRTAPLWGIGLVGVVNGHTNFLHDGRARSLLEAVLWHGGEAEKAREVVRKLPAPSRNALITFLHSL